MGAQADVRALEQRLARVEEYLGIGPEDETDVNPEDRDPEGNGEGDGRKEDDNNDESRKGFLRR